MMREKAQIEAEHQRMLAEAVQRKAVVDVEEELFEGLAPITLEDHTQRTTEYV